MLAAWWSNSPKAMSSMSAWINISPNNCPIHMNIFVIYKNINMNMDSII